MTTNDQSDMRRAMETSEDAQARYERLLAAARRVWEGSRPDKDHPNRMIVAREAMDALGALLADTN
jgi:hypothetical protein